jgi:hydrogenase maturation factor HypF (carbamoyltransferase family)
VAEGPEALALAVQALRRGDIVAIKGVGGYQLVAGARDEAAVAELRRRKHREEKPFAVLFASLEDIQSRCAVTEGERRELTSAAAPIVLCASLADSDLAPSVAMGSPLTGAMLPASPLHHLLARTFGEPLVCTSGNPSGEPLCTDDAEALERLCSIADWVLSHDRPIVRPCDDSVVRVTPNGTTFLRRARGFVPCSLPRPRGGPTVLALGGHLKSAIALAWGREILPSQHIGDLDDAKALSVLRSTIDDLLVFTGARPEIVACDLHPDYGSTRVAEEVAARLGVPLVRVQHHHAHVAAVMAEHDITEPVLGLAWDGSGDGGDGTVWGGEALWCDGATSRRVAHLRPFSLPGGERAVREPRRAAAGLLAEIDEIDRAPGLDDRERRAFAAMIERGMNSPRTTSLGRLFDAVAALLGVRLACSFEGQAAMELEHAARGDLVSAPYPIEIRAETPPFGNRETTAFGSRVTTPFGSRVTTPFGSRVTTAFGSRETTPFGSRETTPFGSRETTPFGSRETTPFGSRETTPFGSRETTPFGSRSEVPPFVIDWEPLVRAILADLGHGVDRAEIARRFHAALADAAVRIAERAGLARVCLGGGCFQNTRLSTAVQLRLEQAGFQVLAARRIPPNDGGLAVGQAHVAAERAFAGRARRGMDRSVIPMHWHPDTRATETGGGRVPRDPR